MATTTAAPTTEREHYLAAFRREYETTRRVLNAFPAAKLDYRPSDRSPTAAQVAWSLVASQMVIEPILTLPELVMQAPPPPPGDWSALVAAFESALANAKTKLKAMTDAEFTSSIVMPVGPGGAKAPMRRADALWMMLYDTVHHRGQFSVYLRASGGKVPSIYGPSGDEPWY